MANPISYITPSMDMPDQIKGAPNAFPRKRGKKAPMKDENYKGMNLSSGDESAPDETMKGGAGIETYSPPLKDDVEKPLFPMSEQEVQQIFRIAVGDAITFTDLELSPARATATRYYNGELFGNEQDGRSQVVLTVVRDAIQAFVKQIMPVFFGSEQVVEFVPRQASQVEMAQQVTDYIDFLFKERNDGFYQAYSVLNDGALKKIGVFKWGWDESETVKSYCEYGLTQEQLRALAADDDVELTKVTPSHDEDEYGPAPSNDVEFTRRNDAGRCIIWSVPPEEFVFSREARSLEDALVIAHRCQKTRGDLIAMGLDVDAVNGVVENATLTINMQPEVIARREQLTNAFMQDPRAGEANDKLTYVEAYMRLDVDGDGINELRKIIGLGQTYRIVSNEPWDERPFAIYSYDPQPHTILGGSLYDRVADLQSIKSLAARTMFDSYALSVYPRTVYKEGGIRNVQDIYNTEIGATIAATKDVNDIKEFTHNFGGRDALGVMEWLESQQEQRTGMDKGTNSLDADSLQSMDKMAVQAAVSSSQAEVELRCRIFGEVMRKMFKGVYKTILKYQSRPEMVRLRGRFVEINPKIWDADMDVMVNTGLGRGFQERKTQTYRDAIALQKDILSQLGPTNPLVGLGQFSQTLSKALELEGIKDTAMVVNRLPLNWQPPPMPPQPPQADPSQTLAMAQVEVERMRAEKELAIKEAELQLKAQTALWDHEEAMAKLELAKYEAAADTATKRIVADDQFHATVTQAQQDQDIKQAQLLLDAEMQHHEIADMAHQQQMDLNPPTPEPEAAPNESQLPTEQQEIDDGEEVSRFLKSDAAVRTIERQREVFKNSMAAAPNTERLSQIWLRLQAFEDLIVAMDTTKQRGEVRKIKKDAAEKAAKQQKR